jgi:hypothetical protein
VKKKRVIEVIPSRDGSNKVNIKSITKDDLRNYIAMGAAFFLIIWAIVITISGWLGW